MRVMLFNALSVVVHAQNSIAVQCDYNKCGWDNFIQLFNNLLDEFITIAIFFATFGVILIGVKYVLAAFGSGSEKAHQEVREIAKSILIGTVLVLGAYLIVQLLFNVFDYQFGNPFSL